MSPAVIRRVSTDAARLSRYLERALAEQLPADEVMQEAEGARPGIDAGGKERLGGPVASSAL